ncbi:DegV family protein [Paenibacillus sp. IB182496]|uniref:DegV family protein n=1 Tax=Paenibacillus sabuli TaxID=2772509 RepID=A0A927BSU9_9BACL|nr:DegV family protein [Paenibacillus sabuli]MBD2846147.1 DegV family protein [Paenibacillus sabuli]
MDQRVTIVTDSTADIPRELRERLQIEMVPLKVHFGNEVFLDGVTIEPDAFYTRLAASSALPTTSQPSPAEFVEAYERILRERPGTAIVSYHLSSAFSGTYQSAVLAQSLMEQDADLTIVDTKSASYGFGQLVVLAAEMAQAGSTREQIIAATEQLHEQQRLYFLVDTLEYLQKGGRIGKASALLGTILNIKPILTIDGEGVVAPVDKVRGTKKAMQRIVDLLRRDFAAEEPVRAVYAYSQSRGAATQLDALIGSHFNVQETIYTELGAVIGTHVGPGTAAIFMSRM